MHYHTVAVDFVPPPVIGAAMSRIAAMLARGELLNSSFVMRLFFECTWQAAPQVSEPPCLLVPVLFRRNCHAAAPGLLTGLCLCGSSPAVSCPACGQGGCG